MLRITRRCIYNNYAFNTNVLLDLIQSVQITFIREISYFADLLLTVNIVILG